MIQISDNTQQIQPSKIRKMFNKALEYDHVISFTLGEPDFTASSNVVEAGCRAIREGKTKYSENAGLLALRQAIAEYLHRTEGLSYDPASQIVVTACYSSTNPAGLIMSNRFGCAAACRCR